MIPYGKQSISEADIEAVVEVLRSDWITQGPMVPRFEDAVASYCGASYAVAALVIAQFALNACLQQKIVLNGAKWSLILLVELVLTSSAVVPSVWMALPLSASSASTLPQGVSELIVELNFKKVGQWS